ncbi:MAG: PSD1 and planctomycete cytochrome C domain-containing protein [Planctomycetaceae bacterium]
MMLSFRNLMTMLVCLPFMSTTSTASAGEKAVDFSRDVLPILSDRCFVCHGPDATEADADMLRLDSFEAAVSRRDAGQAINPDSPADSLLLKRIHSRDNPMPPADAEKQLSEHERDVLTRWVQQGGKYHRHWAFVPPERHLPRGWTTETRSTSPSDIIDALIAGKLSDRGIDFSPPADRHVLARRAAYVLTGLPPERDQLERYLADSSPAGYRNLIEELLASPRFGEHQARYWLDAVRYGDTHGLHLDNRRGIYPYRDWVVRAFNQNLPLDEFITWQLAGDLLPNPTLDQKIATGFVRMNPSTAEGGAIPEEFQAKNNFDRTETLGTVLLGLSLTCARCHTHKYDPVTQTEYYQLLAFFNSTSESPMDGNKYEYGPVLQVPGDQQSWQTWQQLQEAQRELIQVAADGIPRSSKEQQQQWNTADADQRLSMIAAGAGSFQDSPLQANAGQLTQQIEQARSTFTTTLVAEELPQPRPTHLLRRGEYNLPTGDALQPDTLAVIGRLPSDVPHNRLGLAQWLTSPQQPLVSRVLVNRLWQQVFGYGLVRTPEDFGVQGQQPTHPELLDWLAVELQDQHWNLKHLLRLMVHSRTFQQSSAWRTDVDDPENRLFARASTYRLDAEVLRDVGLWSSGLLDPAMGGEGVKPYQPSGMWEAMAHPASNTKSYEADHGRRLYRRGLYVYWKRTSPHPMMTLFDAPDRESSCVRRSRSNTSLQSLGLLNETQRLEMSRALAERLLKHHADDDARVKDVFLMLTCRPPSQHEQQVCRQLLADLRSRYRSSADDAQALTSIGETPRDPALTPAETAAWTQLAATLLASDAAILLY